MIKRKFFGIRFVSTVTAAASLVAAISMPVLAKSASYVSQADKNRYGVSVTYAVSVNDMNEDFEDLEEDDYVLLQYSKADYKKAWNDLSNANYMTAQHYNIDEHKFAAVYQDIWEDYVKALFDGGETGGLVSADHSENFRNFIISRVVLGTYDICTD